MKIIFAYFLLVNNGLNILSILANINNISLNLKYKKKKEES